MTPTASEQRLPLNPLQFWTDWNLRVFELVAASSQGFDLVTRAWQQWFQAMAAVQPVRVPMEKEQEQVFSRALAAAVTAPTPTIPRQPRQVDSDKPVAATERRSRRAASKRGKA